MYSIAVYNYKKKWNLIQKQISCKKSAWPPKKAIVKKDKMVAKVGCDGRLIAKVQ